MSDGGIWARLRAHRGTLAILMIGIIAFGFLAHEDRTARHAAGIDDTCAWFQMINRQFPMNRCFSLDEFFSMLDRHRENPDEAPGPDHARYARPDDDAASNNGACPRSAESATPSPNPERPKMSDDFARLLEGSGSSADGDRIRTDYVYRLLTKPTPQDMCEPAESSDHSQSQPQLPETR